MMKICRNYVLLAFLLKANFLTAQTPQSIVKELQKNESFYNQSIQAVRVMDGKELFSFQSDKLLSPASITKLITGATALKKFTPQHTMLTKIYYTGQRNQGVIQGNLYIKGVGDPYIISEKMWQLAADFRHMGIKEVKGDIIIDDSFFDQHTNDGLRESTKYTSSNAYDAPISAFAINFNTLAIAIAANEMTNQEALIEIDPYPLDSVKIQNNTTTTEKGTNIHINRKTVNDATILTTSGKISKVDRLKKLYRSTGNHIITSGEVFRSFLAAEGIAISGKIRQGKTPSNGSLIYELESYPVSFMVEGLNKFSNNFIADVLLKNLGQFVNGKVANLNDGIGTFQNGLSVVQAFLKQEVGIRSTFVLENGSGLTTGNKLSAQQLNQLLVYMAKDMEVFPEFIMSLPASGRDGTLERRFDTKSTEFLRGKVRAKTGTLSDPISVSSLSGYMQHPKHGLVAFTIIHNGIKGKGQPSVSEFRDIQDKLIAQFFQIL